MRSQFKLIALFAGASALLIACVEEQPVRSVTEFLENPIMLEAVMVRCSADRDRSRYDPECVNARAAVAQIEAKEEAARRAEFEARSDSKRQALRRAQAAAAEARRRTAEAERLRREAEYLAQFGVQLPPDTEVQGSETISSNTPMAEISENSAAVEAPERQSYTVQTDPPPATDGNNAPGAISEPEPEPQNVPTDLESIRDELQRRKEEGND